MIKKSVVIVKLLIRSVIKKLFQEIITLVFMDVINNSLVTSGVFNTFSILDNFFFPYEH